MVDQTTEIAAPDHEILGKRVQLFESLKKGVYDRDADPATIALRQALLQSVKEQLKADLAGLIHFRILLAVRGSGPMARDTAITDMLIAAILAEL